MAFGMYWYGFEMILGWFWYGFEWSAWFWYDLAIVLVWFGYDFAWFLGGVQKPPAFLIGLSVFGSSQKSFSPGGLWFSTGEAWPDFGGTKIVMPFWLACLSLDRLRRALVVGGSDLVLGRLGPILGVGKLWCLFDWLVCLRILLEEIQYG
jgi:hypothetical protein